MVDTEKIIQTGKRLYFNPAEIDRNPAGGIFVATPAAVGGCRAR
jgi:hypothetical protein